MIIPIEIGENSYDIVLERGALERIGEYIELNRKVLIVTDEGVPEVYAQAVKKQSRDAVTVTIPEGEGWQYTKEGRIAYDGDRPINTNGGRCQYGHAGYY